MPDQRAKKGVPQRMLRITVDQQGDPIILKVEGKLSGPWVKELERCWQSTRRKCAGRRLRVELSDVGFVEDRGRVLLREMLHSGDELAASGPMMKSILEEIAAG
ncbi:MAG TPA: hypothetical protein VJP02_11555 [Candidatus Sulfotelmatobacter sp.]|nr:hypothetical protein [Candidatus Sulfotelmatobacter sp.]